MSAFYSVSGNLPAKYKSRLTDIYLVGLTQVKVITKYGYENVLQLLIDDLTQNLDVLFEGRTLYFQGSLSMVVCDNLAAHALGGYLCNVRSVKRFCRFYDCTKDQIQEALPSSNFTFCTNQGYDNIVELVTEFPNLCSVYGMKSKSCLNQLKYFHINNGLPPDLPHDLFEGFAIDIMNLLVTRYL